MKASRASRLRSLGALALATLLVLANAAGAVASLTDLRVGVHPDHTRIVIETDGAAPYVLDPGEREVLVHVDAAASAEALTATSPHLVWVKVEPTLLGADVRIQLKQPVEVKTLVLERPDRIVLDLYPKTRAAQPPAPEPLPAPELLPDPEPPPVIAMAEPEPPAPEPGVGSEDEPGLPEEEAEEPLVLELPDGEPSEEPAPEMEAEPETESAGEPEKSSEVIAGSSVAPGEPSREPGAPTTPAAPAPSGGLFSSPYVLGAAALGLLVFGIWLQRYLRRAEPRRFPALPEEDEEDFEPPQRAIAIAEEAESGESVFDVEPDALEPPEPVPTLRPLVRADADAEDETERRLALLEKRIAELVDAKDRLERQTAAQTEELRVQRAAIARTQRVLRSIAPKGDEEPSEPLARG